MGARRSPYVPLAALATGASAVGLGIAIGAWAPSLDVVLVTATALVLAAPLVVRAASGAFDPFEPIVVFVLAYSVMFVIRPLAEIAGGEYLLVRPSRAIAVDETFTEALVLALVGAVAFVGAYFLPLHRHRPRGAGEQARTPVDGTRATFAALALAGLGVVSFALFLVSTGDAPGAFRTLLAGRSVASTELFVQGSAGLFQGSYLLVPGALLLFALGVVRRSAGTWALGLGLTALVLVRALPTGSRMMLLPFFGGLVVYWYLARNRRPGFLGMVAVLSVALVTSTFLLGIRDASVRGQSSAEAVLVDTVTDPGRLAEPILAGPDSQMVVGLAATLGVVPESTGYRHGGATVGDLLVRLVPRDLWPAKPLPPREQVIATLWPAEYVAGIANPEFSVLFFFFFDFGLAGVAAGMVLYGWLARALWEWFRARSETFAGRLVFAVAVAFVPIALRDSPTDAFVRVAFVLVPLWIALRLAEARRASADEDRRPAAAAA